MAFHALLELFKSTMEQHGYEVRAHENMLSPMFPSTFTLSGGPDLPYNFLEGDKSLKGKKFIVNQPCIRHRDIEKVGDKKHLSFFNMFVADSILGVPRQELIKTFFDLFTQKIGLDKNKIYASYFGGGDIHGEYFEADLEAKEIRLSLGIKEDHLIEYKDELGMEAFVANTVEPVGGPRAELFYDSSASSSNKAHSFKKFSELEQKGEILEFFTTVKYNMKVDHNKETDTYIMKTIEGEAIAGGFGAQRVLSILEKQPEILNISSFNTDKKLFEKYNVTNTKKTSIITDHIQGIIFLIHDGMAELHGQKNRSRRHLYRKYVTKLKNNLNDLGLANNEELLKQLIDNAISNLNRIHPNFDQKKEYIFTNFNDIYNRIDL